ASRHPYVKRAFIRSFAKAYNVSLDEYERQSFNAYESFNDFFTRELKDDARLIDSRANGIVSPADGVISQLGQIRDHKLLQAKGHHYNIIELLLDNDEGSYLADASFFYVFLDLRNYLRLLMLFANTWPKTRYIPCALFSVNNITAGNVRGLCARNKRLVCL